MEVENIVLVMTATINPQCTNETLVSYSVKERMMQYIDAISYYIKETN